MRGIKADINPIDVESRLAKGESLRKISKTYGITHQTLSLRRRIWGEPLRKSKKIDGRSYVDSKGYRMVRVDRQVVRVNPYTYEHIVEAEKIIGRHLIPGEVVHHLNGLTTDNRHENLFVCSRSVHRVLHRQLEKFALELVQKGEIVFDGKNYKWKS